MVTSSRFCKKEEKDCIQVKYNIFIVLVRFKFSCNLCVFFPQNPNSKILRVDKKIAFSSSAHRTRYTFHSTPTLVLNLFRHQYHNTIIKHCIPTEQLFFFLTCPVFPRKHQENNTLTSHQQRTNTDMMINNLGCIFKLKFGPLSVIRRYFNIIPA